MRAAAILVLAGAAGAYAQSGSATWMANVSAPDGGTTADVTLSLMMEADTPFVALSATIFDTLNVGGAEYGEIASWEVLNNLADLTGDLTTTDGDNLYGTNAGQLTVFGPFTSDNPIDVLSFTWEAADGYVIGGGGDLVTYTTSSDNVTLWVGADKDSAEALDITNDVSDFAFEWNVVPSPAGVAVFGLGGLALVRRRR